MQMFMEEGEDRKGSKSALCKCFKTPEGLDNQRRRHPEAGTDLEKRKS